MWKQIIRGRLISASAVRLNEPLKKVGKKERRKSARADVSDSVSRSPTKQAPAAPDWSERMSGQRDVAGLRTQNQSIMDPLNPTHGGEEGQCAQTGKKARVTSKSAIPGTR